MKNALNIVSRPNGLIGSVLVAAVLLTALVGTFYTPYDPTETDFLNRMAGPSGEYLLGTDVYGRDLLSRILAGASVSVMISGLTVGLALAFGIMFGAGCGYLQGAFDRFVMMFMEAIMAFPGILLALSIMVVMGPNKHGVILALAIAYTPSVTRMVRGTVLSVREKEFVEASVANGDPGYYTLFRHILPNCLAPLIVLATTMFGWVLLSESALSFLGLGVPPPAPTWGNMIAEARDHLMTEPQLGIIPGVCVSLALIGINLFGDALRDALDPRNTRLS